MKSVIFLDTETTGLKQEEGHRIIEIALVRYDIATRELIDSFIQRIDPDRAIDPRAQEVHGICYEDLAGCPKWEEVAGNVSEFIQRGDLLVIQNASFDMPFIENELRRVGVEMSKTAPQFCTKENGRWACADGKFPNLQELCFALGVEYDKAKAHGASYDTEILAECFFRGFDRGFFKY